MKKYSDKKEILFAQNTKLNDILKDCFLKTVLYEKALKEDHAQKCAV